MLMALAKIKNNNCCHQQERIPVGRTCSLCTRFHLNFERYVSISMVNFMVNFVVALLIFSNSMYDSVTCVLLKTRLSQLEIVFFSHMS